MIGRPGRFRFTEGEAHDRERVDSLTIRSTEEPACFGRHFSAEKIGNSAATRQDNGKQMIVLSDPVSAFDGESYGWRNWKWKTVKWEVNHGLNKSETKRFRLKRS